MGNSNTAVVSRDTYIEDLVSFLPESVGYLMDNGIRCMRCGEPMWGTLSDAAREKGFGDEDIEKFVGDLNKILQKKDNS